MSDTIQKSDFDLKKFEQISSIEYNIPPPETFVEGVIRTFTIPHGLDFIPTVIGVGYWLFSATVPQPYVTPYKRLPIMPAGIISSNYFVFSRIVFYEVDETNIYLKIGVNVNLTTGTDAESIGFFETVFTKFFLYREQTI